MDISRWSQIALFSVGILNLCVPDTLLKIDGWLARKLRFPSKEPKSLTVLNLTGRNLVGDANENISMKSGWMRVMGFLMVLSATMQLLFRS